MTFQRGDVILVPFLFSDLSMAKVRPAVVFSSDLYHSTGPDLLLAALTSQVAGVRGPFDYQLSDWHFVRFLHQQEPLELEPRYPPVENPASSLAAWVDLVPEGYEGGALQDSEALYDEA